MKRLLCVLCLCGAAWGAEVLKDDEGRVLVPVAKLNAAPLFEVKDVRMTLCRVSGSPEYAIAVSVVFIHRVSSTVMVNVVCDLGDSNMFRKSKLESYVEKVKPMTLTTARFLAVNPVVNKGVETCRFTPSFSFSHSR